MVGDGEGVSGMDGGCGVGVLLKRGWGWKVGLVVGACMAASDLNAVVAHAGAGMLVWITRGCVMVELSRVWAWVQGGSGGVRGDRAQGV